MQEQEIMKMAQAMAAAMAMFSELAKSQPKPNVAARQETKQEQQEQVKPKLQFVPFGRFSTLRISTANTENGTIVNVRKGEQFVTFLFNEEVANGLLQLIEQYYPNLLGNSPKPNRKGRGA